MPSIRGSAAIRREATPLCWFALALAASTLLGCNADPVAMDLPWSTVRPAGATSKKAEPVELDVDCDDLPSLTPEEVAGLPQELRLERAIPTSPPESTRYTTLPDVILSDEAAAKVSRLDDAYARRTKEHLVITSGTRDAAHQARAMYKMIELGADIVRLYRNKSAAREIQAAYRAGRGKPPGDVVVGMYAVIKSQMARGIYISAHLRAGAVDVRSRAMNPSERQAFVKSVAEVGGAVLLEESKPPHYHLQIE